MITTGENLNCKCFVSSIQTKPLWEYINCRPKTEACCAELNKVFVKKINNY